MTTLENDVKNLKTLNLNPNDFNKKQALKFITEKTNSRTFYTYLICLSIVSDNDEFLKVIAKTCNTTVTFRSWQTPKER
jgi:hypothetical protein